MGVAYFKTIRDMKKHEVSNSRVYLRDCMEAMKLTRNILLLTVKDLTFFIHRVVFFSYL